MDRPKVRPVSILQPDVMVLPKTDKLELKPIKKVEIKTTKSKKQLKREKAARVRAARLKNKDGKSSTYTTSSLDPNASVNYNAMSEAMFK